MALKDNPHQNLVRYSGRFIRNGHLIGFVPQKYECSAVDSANGVTVDLKSILGDVVRGLDHLHSLGFNQNNVHLGKIMLDSHNRPVLIDVEFATPPGTHIHEISKSASCENDYSSVQRISVELRQLRASADKVSK